MSLHLIEDFSGYSGISGFSGRVGPSGASGHSGASGFSGISGFSGTSLAAGAFYFLHQESSDVSGYNKLLREGSNDVASALSTGPILTGADAIVGRWTTDPGEPGTTVWGTGEYRLDVEARRQGGGVGAQARLFWRMYQRTGTAPGNRILIGTSSLSNYLDTAYQNYSIQFQLPAEVEVSSADRFEIEVLGRDIGGDGTQSVDVRIEGITGTAADANSHIHTGVTSAFGSSGKSGTSGYSGTSGFSGMSGFSGATGTGVQEFDITVTFSSASAIPPLDIHVGRVNTLAYDPDTKNAADFSFDFPDDLDPDRDLEVNLVYHMASGGALGNVRIELAYEVVDNLADTTPPGPTGVLYKTLTPSATAEIKEETNFTIPSTSFSSTTQSIRFTLIRDAASLLDTDGRVFHAENISIRYTGFGAPVQNSGLSGISGFSGSVQGAYGNINTQDGSTSQSLTGGDPPTKVTGFAADGLSSGMTVDYSQGEITASIGGTYLVNFCCSFSGTTGTTFQLHLRKNGNELAEMATDLKSSGDLACVGFNGLASLVSSDVVSVYVEADGSGSKSFVPVDMQLTLNRLP